MLFWIAGSVCLARELLMDLRQIVLTVGILNMCQELSPFAHEMYSAPKQVARGPHLGRIDIRLRQHPAAQEHSDLVGIDLIVLGLAPMDGFHVEGVAQDEGNPLLGAEVGQPVPGEDTFDADDEILPVRRNRLEKRLGCRFHIAVQHDLAVLIQDAEVHGAGVQVDATIKLVLLGVESHEVSSSS
jgi:hypothetical protein